MSEAELREAFQAFGEVTSASIIKDKFTGESRGFGFVEMPNKAEADAAISGLNGKDLKGRAINVNEARPRTDRPRTGGGFGGRGGSRGGFGGSRRY
jgi:RNA recognition motif-containing protein